MKDIVTVEIWNENDESLGEIQTVVQEFDYGYDFSNGAVIEGIVEFLGVAQSKSTSKYDLVQFRAGSDKTLIADQYLCKLTIDEVRGCLDECLYYLDGENSTW